MKPIATLPDSSLTFHATDAENAVAANPRNPKAAQYLAEMHACERELLRRATIRARRAKVRTVTDPLTAPIRSRHWHRNRPAFYRTEARDAAFSLAFLTHCTPKQ